MNVLHFDSEAAWVHTICAVWRDRLRSKPDLRMCLPSGKTPVAIYAEMARSVRAGLASFRRAQVFALDEFGGVSADDPGSTRQMLKQQLADHVDLPPDAFHCLDPAAPDVSRECADYEAAIADGFDLMLLGIGTNGHLGMNESGSPVDSTTRRVDLHESTIQASARYFTHGNLPRWGLTVGLKNVLDSKEVWVLANGANKAEIVERTVRGEIAVSNPASLLRNHSNCSVFVDASAGRLL